MSGPRDIHVIITTYHEKRADVAGIIAEMWADCDRVAAVWLLDCGNCIGDHVGPYSPMVIKFPVDPGNCVDYAMATLTKTPYVILADDDLYPHKELASDMLRGYEDVGGGDTIVGLIGRTFNGPDYYKDTEYFRSDKVGSAVKVGFCGVVCLAPRSAFGFDTFGAVRNADDLWWQLVQRPTFNKYVVPTKAYTDAPECRDDTAMYRKVDLRPSRQETYSRFWDMQSHGR